MGFLLIEEDKVVLEKYRFRIVVVEKIDKQDNMGFFYIIIMQKINIIVFLYQLYSISEWMSCVDVIYQICEVIKDIEEEFRIV